MSFYTFFRPQMPRMVKTARLSGYDSRLNDYELSRELVKTTVKNLQGIDQPTLDNLYFEWLYNGYNRPIYFIDNARFLRFLESASFNIKADCLSFPSPVFSVAIPSEVSFKTSSGHQYPLSGFLAVRLTIDEHLANLRRWLQWCGLGDLPIEFKSEDEKVVFGVSCYNPIDGSYLRGLIHGSAIDNGFRPEWFEKNISAHSLFTPNHDDAIILGRITSLMLRFVAFMNAFPQEVRSGLPDGLKAKHARLVPSNNIKTIGLPSMIRNSPDAHFRNHHLRHLWNERYRRDEQGNVRMIWVRPAIIGGKHDSYTAEHKFRENK